VQQALSRESNEKNEENPFFIEPFSVCGIQLSENGGHDGR
jgi:hypothetical protein